MAGLAGLIAAIARSAARSLRRFGSLTGNNLVAVIALLMAEEPLDRPSSTAVFYLVIGLLAAFPLATELARRIPAERLALWPLARWQRAAAGLANFLLNPALLLAIAFPAISRDPGIGFLLLAVGAAAPLLLSGLRWWKGAPSFRLRVPRAPGRLGGLIQNRLREILETLDFWLAVLLAAGGGAYRVFAANPDPMMPVVLCGLIVIVLSTAAQANVHFDVGAARTRVSLMPLSGVDVLLASDAAWLLALLPLTVPLGILAAGAGGFAALAIGHRTAQSEPMQQHRWQFASGELAPTGLLQILCVMVAVPSAHQFGAIAAAAAVAAWAGSLYWYGRSA